MTTQLSSALISNRSRALCGLAGLALLSACATLPASGPTAGEIKQGAKAEANTIGFKIVDIDGPTLAGLMARDKAADAAVPTFASLAETGRNDVVGPGDVLSVGVYEVGVSLFSAGHDTTQSYDPSAHGQEFPSIVVDRDGAIRLPYVGRLQVAGHTAAEIQTMIEHALKGKSQNPQALVGIKQALSTTVYVTGDARRPGRMSLSLQRERLLDAIALAGGPAGSAEDTIVRFNRGDRTLEERLGRIRAGAPDDLVLIPGDRIELIKRPRTFIVLGATSRVSQVPFETGDLSLAEAMARAGGPSDGQADPSAVFLFRYDPTGPDDASSTPIIYRLNMLKPVSYFLSQRFEMHDKDVIYIANASSIRPTKLVNIINQLFSPFIAARALSR